VEWNGRRNDLR